jgi:hypothetical protein
LERLRLFDQEDLAAPTAIYIAPLSDFLAASSAFGVERPLAQQLASGAQSYARVVRDGLLQRLKLWFAEYDIVKDRQPLAPLGAMLVGELHCPNVPGATAQLEARSKSDRSIALDITAGGVGGGGWTHSRGVSTTATISASAGSCLGLYVHLDGTYSTWKHPDTHRIAILVNVTKIEQLFPRDLASTPSHLCTQHETYHRFLKQVELGNLALGEDYVWYEPQTKNPTTPAPTYTTRWEQSREYTCNAAFDVALGTVGVTLTSRFVQEVEVTTALPWNHNYIGRYESPCALPQQWGASP